MLSKKLILYRSFYPCYCTGHRIDSTATMPVLIFSLFLHQGPAPAMASHEFSGETARNAAATRSAAQTPKPCSGASTRFTARCAAK